MNLMMMNYELYSRLEAGLAAARGPAIGPATVSCPLRQVVFPHYNLRCLVADHHAACVGVGTVDKGHDARVGTTKSCHAFHLKAGVAYTTIIIKGTHPSRAREVPRSEKGSFDVVIKLLGGGFRLEHVFYWDILGGIREVDTIEEAADLRTTNDFD